MRVEKPVHAIEPQPRVAFATFDDGDSSQGGSDRVALRDGLELTSVDPGALMADLLAIAPKVLPYAQPAWRVLADAGAAGRRVLFEGAQATMLDVDHGTYPFVTSSNTVAGQAAAGAGVGPKAIGRVLGIMKAYATRVGEGPFPSEQLNAVGRRLGERGNEFGTVTGRPRRCGWFDAVLARQSVTVAGVEGVALTKLDVLDGFETLNICVGYRLGDQLLDHLPAGLSDQAAVSPVYESMEGWKVATRGARAWSDLPTAAQAYVRRLEALVGAQVFLLTTSPERDDLILLRDPFED